VAREDSIDVICTLRSRELINAFLGVFPEIDVQGNMSRTEETILPYRKS